MNPSAINISVSVFFFFGLFTSTSFRLSCFLLESLLTYIFLFFLCGLEQNRRGKSMADQAAKSVAKAIGEYQYPWREKLVKYKTELSKGTCVGLLASRGLEIIWN